MFFTRQFIEVKFFDNCTLTFDNDVILEAVVLLPECRLKIEAVISLIIS